ncbi:UTP--glucose-1-phosphate uridylyltransferase [Micromonospora globispora]|uniref:UTP--glucose-1-phosphate uridylyltransferase n=1 Tax=Micromonospora globispora TaxID=1450148 RepID=A0A317JTV3_9ACTN|nr:UTP--glucose-1-phosphate uridylyltransferase [Micromonospora globispora]PWU43810.1 UTP--glucose-1-phosphate uridylyltransferase [Micromonospora globispora]PWU62295.1 UTP--glucose-1-phosphate uridylyltransferase [Micromonospora globispora]RQW99027.1 UTP--glucose-1-phosphate uridylyltransferase [Micromonospora globispora]
MSEHSANPSATAATGRPRAVKAVIPAAGLATRFLPATKAVPKELLPVVDRPVLQYIVEEATQAGINDVLLITGRGKTSMVDHFDRRPDLEAKLEEKGDTERLAAVQRPSELAEIYTCRQPEQLGLGHAVGYAESHVGDQPFAVLLGDEFVKMDEPLLPAMLELQARTGGVVLAFFEVDPADTKRYGIASVEPAEPEFSDIAEVVKVTGLVEKPKPEEAPSNLAVLGRYVLPGKIFDAIRRTEPGSGGEIQLTDAMEILRNEGTPVHAIVYRGTRYDTGMPLGYLQTVVQIAAEREDLGPEFRKWLVEFVNSDASAGPGR